MSHGLRILRAYALRFALALVIFLVAGELLARTLNVVDRLNGYSRMIYTRGPSADLPYLLRPGLRTTLYGTELRINAAGFRGPEIAPVPAAGVRRVLVAGDSVVFGQGMPEDETLPGVLARELNARGRPRYEVVNAGVPGYDAVSGVRLLEAVGLALRPAIVVLGVSLNDYDVTPMYSPLGFLIRKDVDRRTIELVDRFEFLALLRWLVHYLRGTLAYQVVERVDEQHRAHPETARWTPGQAAVAMRVVQDQHLAFYHAPLPRYWNRLRAAYVELGRLAATHGVDLLVAIFPEEYQIGVAEPDLTPQRLLLEACRDAELRCLDLRQAFAAAGGELFGDVQHPNARGHAVAAAAIAAALLDGH